MLLTRGAGPVNLNDHRLKAMGSRPPAGLSRLFGRAQPTKRQRRRTSRMRLVGLRNARPNHFEPRSGPSGLLKASPEGEGFRPSPMRDSKYSSG